MTIPVRNLYYLLLYAWNHFQAGALTDVGADDSPDLPNLLSQVLLDGTHRLLRRGVDRGYCSSTELTRAPRGRLVLDAMIKQQTMMRGLAVCELDELTPDVLHNQILLSTLLALSGCQDVDRQMRHHLRHAALRLNGVSTIRLTGDLFHRVQLSRNTAQYGLLMRVCAFVFWSLLPDEQGTGSRFQSILEDDLRMSAVFEEFLRNFYRSEFPEFKVGSEIMPWAAQSGDPTSLALLPIMRTDITLRAPHRTMIIDAKYYRETLTGGRFGKRVQSAHLYQLVTYLAHEEQRSGIKPSGLLLYPETSEAVRGHFELLGYPLTVATIDLSAQWTEIRSVLRSFITMSAH